MSLVDRAREKVEEIRGRISELKPQARPGKGPLGKGLLQGRGLGLLQGERGGLLKGGLGQLPALRRIKEMGIVATLQEKRPNLGKFRKQTGEDTYTKGYQDASVADDVYKEKMRGERSKDLSVVM